MKNSNQNQCEKNFSNEKEFRQWAKNLGKILPAGILLGLIGDLGVGKTTFVQALVSGMKGIGEGDKHVRSPTFVLIHEYPTKVPVIHVDLYRLPGRLPGDSPAIVSEALEGIGIRDYLDGNHIVAIEWFNRLPQGEYDPDIQIEFSFGKSEEERNLKIIFGKSLPTDLKAMVRKIHLNPFKD